MQPISLKLENFGPYEATDIDFSVYYTQTLFLITGKTGSGKTTIFDGMTYALYGKTSGGLRDGKEMRSNFASPNKKTRVVFEFKQNDHYYVIEREPEQQVKKVNGDGFREQKNTARLTVFDKNRIEVNQLTKISEVDKFIVELVQLSREQFSQIVMLPQGEFRRFLNANSNSKEIVLRKLFNTYFYRDIAKALREKKKEQEADFKGLDHQLLAQLNQLEWQQEWQEKITEERNYQTLLTYYDSQHKEYEEMRLAYQHTLNELQEKVKQQQQLIHSEEKVMEQLNEKNHIAKELDGLNDEQRQIELDRKQVALLTKIAKVEPLIELIESLKRDQEKRTTKISELTLEKQVKSNQLLSVEEQKRALQEEKEAMLSKEKQVVTIEAAMPLFEEKNNVESSLLHVRKAIDTLTVTSEETKTKQVALLKKITHVETFLKQESTLLVEKVALKESLTQANEELKNIQEYQLTYEELTQLENEYKHLKEAISQQQLANAQHKKEMKQLESNWARAQIAKLSLKLIDGEACLVCGSTTHPNPSHGSELTESDIEQLEVSLEKMGTEAIVLNEQLVTLNSDMTYKEKEIVDKKLRLEKSLLKIKAYFAEDTDSSEWLDMAQEKQAVIDKQLRDIETTLITIKQQNEELITLKKEEANLLSIIETELAKLKALDYQRIELETVYASLLKRLPTEWKTLDEMLSKKSELLKQLTEWNQAVEIADQKLAQIKLDIASISSTLISEETEKKALIEKNQQAEKQVAIFLVENELEEENIELALGSLGKRDSLQKKVTDFDNKRQMLLLRSNELEKNLKGKKIPDMSLLIKEQEQTTQALEDKRKESTELDVIMKKNQQIVTQVTVELEEKKEAQESLLELTELTDVMIGDGLSKLSMERFVLQTYLKKILQRGNEKLAPLTNGRYQFEIKEEQGSSKKATGLEINIFDDNAGSIRSVNTLSGGESFIAALCLSLSLAEIIQEEAGGIKIDAMFIDEGFGSLDEDALEMAIRALENIEGAGRIIGIISHVRELKERIPQQLQIVSEYGKSQVIERLEFE